MNKQDEVSNKHADGTTASTLDELDTSNKNLQSIGVELLTVHTEGTVHAKRIPGTFRKVKWIIASLWLAFFFSPYLQWEGRQAVLFDLGEREFHIFWLTILPQDIWVLAMILLFFALLLAASTAVAGRLWCGYACFHTVWMDVFTWIEEKTEGLPHKRVKLESAPWTLGKIKTKLPKWLAWGFIGFMTGFSFVAYFDPALDLWLRLFTLDWTVTESAIILSLAGATVFFAGFLRDQVCTGFCPYSRIQGAMIDTETVLPTYDVERGEPRGRIHRAKPGEEAPDLGDCIDCNLCVAVCPTGVDIRKGQQFGCITCGLCIDACDSVMEKIKKPKGLIRYASLAEFAGKPAVAFFKRPRVMIYSTIMTFAAAMIVWGLATMSPVDVKVLHERAPMFVKMSDRSIQNKYYVKVVNKMTEPLELKVSASADVEGLVYIADKVLRLQPGKVGTVQLLLRVPSKNLVDEHTAVVVHVQSLQDEKLRYDSSSVFIGPKPKK